MTSQSPTFSARLFYSYCHKDAQYKNSMERSLALLKSQGLLNDWSDQSILPGQKISQSIKKKIDEADIVVFLLSQNFIASTECMKEWERAKQLTAKGKLLFRIPIILKHCAWLDMLAKDDVKALPNDGEPVNKFDDEDTAWHEVYEGIKAVIYQLRNTFTPKPEFIKEIEKIEFLSQQDIKLQDIFVFLPLSCYTPQDGQVSELIINQTQLLKKKYAIIHGEELSGKTALGRHLFLSLTEKSSPVLYVDLEQVPRTPKEKFLRDTYCHQFNGDYSLWKQQSNKTLILDNLSSRPYLIDFVVFAKDFFEKIIITVSSDIFNSFFRDEVCLTDFFEMKIEPLTYRQQEELIRKRLALSDRNELITDGFIDQVEDRINSIIISSKIVPRYPFFVLSILQTYEAFMPNNMSITSYGHCYHILIVSTLMKAGISRSDNDINTCFNFAENLAFKIYQNNEHRLTNKLDLEEFVKEYGKKFIIPKPFLHRLKDENYGIITKDGYFRKIYMYYFFLGRFLSKKNIQNKTVIEQMCEKSYVTSNYLTLLFIIHHTNDNQIIDHILLRTMCALDLVQPAVLDQGETKRFGNIIDTLEKDVLSPKSVEEERKKERDVRDHQDEIDEETDEETDEDNPVNWT